MIFRNPQRDMQGLNKTIFKIMEAALHYKHSFNVAMEMHKSGRDAGEILQYLVSAAEDGAGSETVSSILVLDGEGLLRNKCSPKLPTDYLQAIDGLKPDPGVGTCAAAAATGCMVTTPSFYADNKWAELRHLPLSLGFAGAWSVPIKSGGNKVIGTFGTYLRESRHPTGEEVAGVELLASLVAIILGESVEA
jgi:GAF domain-containing protein